MTPPPDIQTSLSRSSKSLKTTTASLTLSTKRLYPITTLIPRFYGLPKVHKVGAPLRLIVASRGSITYAIACKVADILAPLVGKNGLALKNSADLVTQLNDLQLDEDEMLVSFDVTALFTCTPVALSVDIFFELLQN